MPHPPMSRDRLDDDHMTAEVHRRPINTIRSILVHPKDKTPDAQKCGLVYQVECPACPLTYIGETGRTLATRMKDHLKLRNPLTTAVGEHSAHEHHKITKDRVKVLARGDICIGVNRPAFGGTVPHFHQMSRVPRNVTDVPHF